MTQSTRDILTTLIILLLLLFLYFFIIKSQSPELSPEDRQNVPPTPQPSNIYNLGPGSTNIPPEVSYDLPPNVWEVALFQIAQQIAAEAARRLEGEENQTQNIENELNDALQSELENTIDIAIQKVFNENTNAAVDEAFKLQLKTKLEEAIDVFIKENEITYVENDTAIKTAINDSVNALVETNLSETIEAVTNAQAATQALESQIQAELTSKIASAVDEVVEVAMKIQGVQTLDTQIQTDFTNQLALAVEEALQSVTQALAATQELDSQVRSELVSRLEFAVDAFVEASLAAQNVDVTLGYELRAQLADQIASAVDTASEAAANARAAQALESEIQAQLADQIASAVDTASEAAANAQAAAQALESQIQAELTSKIASAIDTATEAVTNAQAATQALESQIQAELTSKIASAVDEVVEVAMKIQGVQTLDTQIQTDFTNQLALAVEEALQSVTQALAATQELDSQVRSELVSRLEFAVDAFVEASLAAQNVDMTLGYELRAQLADQIASAVDTASEAAANARAAAVALETTVQISLTGQQATVLETALQTFTSTRGPGFDNELQVALNTTITALTENINTISVSSRQNVDTEFKLGLTSQQLRIIEEALSVNEQLNRTFINTETALALDTIKNKITFEFGNKTTHIAYRKTRPTHTRLASTEVARIGHGIPELNENSQIDLNTALKWIKPGYDSKITGAFGYIPPKSITDHVLRWKRDVQRRIIQAYKQSYKTKTVPTLGVAGTIDFVQQFKIGRAFMEFIDVFDNIADQLSIVCTFFDGFFYDPDGSQLGWNPLSPKVFTDQVSKMVNVQIDYINDYNSKLNYSIENAHYPYFPTDFPLITGPLDFIESQLMVKDSIDVIQANKMYGDPEYRQEKITTLIDVIREKILRDPNSYYHIKLLDAAFNGDEQLMTETYTNPVFSGPNQPDDKLVYYVNALVPTDFDNLYGEAFDIVCTRYGGQTYTDFYKGTNRKRFQCGFKTRQECDDNATRWSENNGQIGTYGEWFSLDSKLLYDSRTNKPASDSILLDRSRPDAAGISNPTEACVVIGSGMRSLCKISSYGKGVYDSGTHQCTMSEEACQSFGTCWKTTTEVPGGYCYLPRSVYGVQQFFGQSTPREFIRIYGCYENESVGNQIATGLQETLNVLIPFTKEGKQFWTDMIRNRANWNKGMQEAWNNPDTIVNTLTILIPMLITAMAVPIAGSYVMVGIAIACAASMADSAIKLNRSVAQTITGTAAEYSLGSWSTVEQFNNVFMIETMSTSDNITFKCTTTLSFDFQVGDQIELIFVHWLDNNQVDHRIDQMTTTVATISDSMTCSFPLSVTFPNFNSFVEKRGYIRKPKPSQLTYIDNPIEPGTKIPLGPGLIPQTWVTRPLPLESKASKIKNVPGVVELDFYTDVDTYLDADGKYKFKRFPEGQGCDSPFGHVKSKGAYQALQQAEKAFFDLLGVKTYESIISEFRSWYTTTAQQYKNDLDNAKQAYQDALDRYNTIKNCTVSATAFFNCIDQGITRTAEVFADTLLVAGNLVKTTLEALNNLRLTIIESIAKILINIVNNILEVPRLADAILKLTTIGLGAVSDPLNVDWTGRCVNSRIKMNFRIAKAIGDLLKTADNWLHKSIEYVTNAVSDLSDSFGHDFSDVLTPIVEFMIGGSIPLILTQGKCIVTGKFNVDVPILSDTCYMATAVDSATGTITAPGTGTIANKVSWDDWMDGSLYKRLCSNLNPPMIHAGAAALGNKLWCLPAQPPVTWSNPQLGPLDPLETPYQFNRIWTNFADGPEYFSLYYPQFPYVIQGEQQPSETIDRGLVKKWYYQFAYSQSEFNKQLIWDNNTLSEYFNPETIGEMRKYYCEEDFYNNTIMDEQSNDSTFTGHIDDRCWGYLPITVTNYSYYPMSLN